MVSTQNARPCVGKMVRTSICLREVFSLLGFKGNLRLLEICLFLPGAEANGR